MQITEYSSRQEAAHAAGRRLANGLYQQLQSAPSASLIVSGGSTPAPVLSYLSHKDLDWHRVQVVLSDERWVAKDHPDSNAGMLDEYLFQSRAAFASYLPLYQEGENPESALASLDAQLKDLPQPYAGVLLGMGADGHFASLFPDAPNLAAGLALNEPQSCIAVDTLASEHRRISLTLSALTCANEILLLISGEEKKAVLNAAMKPGSELPVASLLRQDISPVRVIWSP